MQRLSATAAVSPAWRYTRQLLLVPRRWQLLLKIGAVAFFAQMGGGFNFNLGSPGRMHGLPDNYAAMLLPLLLLIGFFSLLIGLALIYIGSRLQFVLFDVVLRRDTTVAPIWRRYGAATWPWIGLKLVCALVGFLAILLVLLCMSPVLIPVIMHLVHIYQATGDLSATDFIPVFLIVVVTFLVLFVVLLVFTAGFILVLDFGLPSMALEATTIRETLRRVWRLFRAETGQVLLYLLLRFVLGIAAAFVLEFCLFLIAMVVLIPTGGLAAVLWFALHDAGTLGYVVMALGWAVLALVFLAVVLPIAIMGFGYFLTFLQAYALFFLGGRYPLVGQYLEGFLPPPVGYPPPQSAAA